MMHDDRLLDHPRGSFCFDQRRGGRPQFEIRTLSIDTAQGESQGAHVVAGYRRWLAFDTDDLPGQDFCGFQFDDHHAVGVVTDGVSQSFFGDIAARIVGGALIAYLWKRRDAPPGEDDVREELNAGQSWLAKEVLEHKLSKTLDSVVRSVLNDARAEGSQTTFGGVLLDRQNKIANIYLLGDITAVVHGASPQPELVSGHKRGRWSSVAPSLRGHIVRETRTHVEAVMLKSDGADGAWGQELREVIQGEIFCERANAWAENDDVSFVWLATAPALQPAAQRVAIPSASEYRELPAPQTHEPETHRQRDQIDDRESLRADVYRHPYTAPRSRSRRERRPTWRLQIAGGFGLLVVGILTMLCAMKQRRDESQRPVPSEAMFPFEPAAHPTTMPDAAIAYPPAQKLPPAAQRRHPAAASTPAEVPEPVSERDLAKALTRFAFTASQDRSSSDLVILVSTSVLQDISYSCKDADGQLHTGTLPASGIVVVSGRFIGSKYHCHLTLDDHSSAKPEIECEKNLAGPSQRSRGALPHDKPGLAAPADGLSASGADVRNQNHDANADSGDVNLDIKTAPWNDWMNSLTPTADGNRNLIDGHVTTEPVDSYIDCRMLIVTRGRG
jgi:hypothetical protein